WGRARAFGVGNDHGLARLEERDDGVRGAEIDADGLGHGAVSWGTGVAIVWPPSYDTNAAPPTWRAENLSRLRSGKVQDARGGRGGRGRTRPHGRSCLRIGRSGPELADMNDRSGRSASLAGGQLGMPGGLSRGRGRRSQSQRAGGGPRR